MLRKLLIATFAVLPACCWSWGSGFYVGGGLGMEADTFYQGAHVYQPSNLPGVLNFNVINQAEFGAQDIFGTVFGGYGWFCGMYYLGGELNFDLSAAESKTLNLEIVHSGLPIGTTYKINRNWGASILPGIVLPETTLIYARLGYAGGHYVVTTHDTSLANADTYLNGIRVGAGIEKRVFGNFAVRFDYSHINYENHANNVVDVSNGVATYKTTVITPNSNLYEFSLVYRFC